MTKTGVTVHTPPSAPSVEQIIEDLSQAPADDVIFKMKYSYAEDGSTFSEILSPSTEYEESQIVPATAYLKVDSFLSELSKFRRYLITLSEQRENLSEWEKSLLERISSMEKELSGPKLL